MSSKKNSWSRGKNGGIYIPGKVRSELDDFLWQLKKVRSAYAPEPLEGNLSVEVGFYNQQKKDLDNMTTTLLDLLQKGRIIKNDKDVVRLSAWKSVGDFDKLPRCIVTLALL